MFRLDHKPSSLSDGPISPQLLDSSPSPSLAPTSVLSDTDSLLPDAASRRQARPSKFLNLPKEAISSVLWAVDSNTFASLCLLNRQWYHEAQKVELYAHHLSRCPSYALSNSIITGPFRHKNDLFRLKAKFAAEARRNLFDAFTQPRRTLVNLISINANSSAAFPGGEAFRFEFSPNGQTLLALSSSRIYVLDATTESIKVKREFKTLRRALSASITDDGTLLAVLSSKFQANIYGIPSVGTVQHLQCIPLEHSPRTIAIAHEGTVLAAAYETGVEVFSLASNALTTDRRAVRSEAVDTLSFSGDGSMLVGSALSLDEPNAVIISAPFYTDNDPDSSPREMHSRMWTTQILFPQISSVCSHVALLPGHSEGDATWLFAYDHSLLSYRAVRTDDTRSGIAYFHHPPGSNRFSMPAPTIAPTASACGTLVVAGFGGTGLCMYGIPEKLDVGPDMAAVIERHEQRIQRAGPMTSATGHLEPLMAYSPSVSGTSESIEDDALASKVDWRQSLFVKCKALETMHGYTAAKWVERPVSGDPGFKDKRLVVTAPGGVNNLAPDLGEENMPVDGSRICLLDFNYGPSAGQDREITVEVGESLPELLTEPLGTMATEVALERKRTVRQVSGREPSRLLLARSITSISPPTPSFANEWKPRSNSQPSSPAEEVPERRLSANSLQRSATAAGFRHARYPPRPPLGSQQYSDQNGVPNFGRAGSVDSWESPPPPYTNGGPNTSHVPSGQAAYSAQRSGPAAALHQNSMSPVAQQPDSQPQPHNYMPYRHLHPRQSTGLDGMPMSDAAPSRRTMSQYGAFQRPARLRDPGLNNLDTVAEAWHRQAVRSMDLSSASSDMNYQNIDAGFARPRPLTHHGGSQVSPRSLDEVGQTNVSIPSPMSPNREYSPTSPDSKSRLSLTGANLKNRLNHPVPPVPEEMVEVPRVPDHLRPSSRPAQSQATSLGVPLTTANNTAYISVSQPHPTNFANISSPTPNSNHQYNPPAPGPLTTPVHRKPVDFVAAPLETQWSASNAHTNHNSNNSYGGYQQSHNFAEDYSPIHNMMHADTRHGLTSASTPNLLPFIQNHSDAGDGDSTRFYQSPVPPSGLGRRVSRAQSLIQRSRTHQREQSAYTETNRTIPGFGRRAKADKKKVPKNDNDSGGGRSSIRSKCLVM